MPHFIHQCWRFYSSRRGAAGMLFSLLMPMLIAGTGMGVDAAFWLRESSRLRAATDQAAISAAWALFRDGGYSAVNLEALSILQKHYRTEFAALRPVVNQPPLTGNFAGDAGSVEVIVQRDQPVFFLNVFGITSFPIEARAVSQIRTAGDSCLLGLHTSEPATVGMTGSSIVDINCGIASNSSSSESVNATGSTTVIATHIQAVGGIAEGGSASITTSEPNRPYAIPLADPYGPLGRNLQVPQFPTGCSSTNLKVHNNTTISPGRYCGGIRLQGGTLTLNPGVYIIDAGDLKAVAGSRLIGTDVTFVLTGSGNNYAQLDFAGNTSFDLHAPKTGSSFNGVLFFQDPQAPSYKGNNVQTNKLLGGSDLVMSGAVYFPSQEIVMQGGSNSQIECLQLIGLKVTFTGNSRITNTCDASYGTEKIARFNAEVVE